MSPKLRASIHRILFATAALTGTVTTVSAQETTEEIAEIVIVTGSYIRGTAEDAALPVDVFTSDELAKQGSPIMSDLIKSIPAVQGVFGESNQFGTANATGISNVNLRGLGPTRTLVLLNGRRIAPAPAINAGVDVNLFPAAALGRIEVLKDGAAATYGSDAIGGVVNFITKEGFEGLAVDGSYSYIDGSDGDYNANVAYGWQGDSSNALFGVGYRHRSELSTTERSDWAVRSLTDNPQGGWSGFGNPGAFFAGGTAPFRDPACANLGVPGVTATGLPTCQFQYIVFDNLVEREEHYQAYAEYNLDITESLSFHAEALYGAHDVPEENSSPSYGPSQGATGLAPSYIVPRNNPGVVNLLAGTSLTPAQVTAINTSGFVAANGLFWRPFGSGGNPLTGEGKQDERKYETFRGSFGLKGEIGSSIFWDTAVTYSETSAEISTPDILVSRLDLALRGLGGPNCTGTTAGANGCLWLNPFASAYPGNPATNVPNPTYVPGLENSPELVKWLFVPNSYESTNELLVVDAVLSGELPFSLPGGVVGWAAGAQYRDSAFIREVSDFSDIDVNPCAQTPITGTTACTAPGANPGPNGALSFFGPLADQDLSQDVFAGFAEFNIPILDSFQAQLAVRYEDYGGEVGDTTNPKLSMRWQIIDELALRGSVGTTFRAPPETSLAQGYTTTLAFTQAAGGYKPYDTYGNANLKPETADTFNVGLIAKVGGFTGTVDYWSFKFEDVLTAEPGTGIVASVFTSYVDSNGVTQANHCGDAAYAGLISRMSFTGGVCGAGTLLRTRANNINSSQVDVSGIDVGLNFAFSAGPTEMMVGLDGTYNLEYETQDLVIEGITIEEGGDRIGTRGSSSGTLPEWKASAYIDLGADIHNVRWTTRYVDGVQDGVTPSRATIFATNPNGREVDSFITHDLVYRVMVGWDTTVTASVFNVMDEEPAFARLDLSYDPFIANPLGRYWKVGVAKKF